MRGIKFVGQKVWREENPDLPDNYNLPYGRLNSLVKRLRENPEMLKLSDDVLKDQLNKRVTESVVYNSIQRKLRIFIPHYAVVTPNKKNNEVLNWYGASAKTKKSNVTLVDLCTLLMRFRSRKIVLVADIEKAFLQVGLQEKDRDVTRFLWLKNITKSVTTENIAVLRFTRKTFGVISSQFILAATIVHHLMEKGTAVSENQHCKFI